MTILLILPLWDTTTAETSWENVGYSVVNHPRCRSGIRKGRICYTDYLGLVERYTSFIMPLKSDYQLVSYVSKCKSHIDICSARLSFVFFVFAIVPEERKSAIGLLVASFCGPLR